MRLIAAAIITTCISYSSVAADITSPFTHTLDTLRNLTFVCAEFHQSKHFKILSQPLLSSGRMVFRRGEGVLWRVIDPISSLVVLRFTSMTRWDESGKAQIVDYGRSPVLGTLGKALVSVISGNARELESSFQVSTNDVSAKGWSVSLVPRQAEIARVVARIEVGGDSFARTIKIEELGGDRTEITFSSIMFEGCIISAKEKSALAQ